VGIICTFKCHYRKQLILKTADTKDGRLLQDAAQMKLDVLYAMHLIVEPWRLRTPTTVKNCFLKCGSLIEHVSSNDGSAVRLTDGEEDDWQSTTPRSAV
jgi:hypothetical protein